MTTFIDGPAKGQTLLLKGAPMLLIVVRDSSGVWDALDQPGDSIRPDEVAYTYERVGDAGRIHLNAGKRSGFYAMAQYRLSK